MSATSSATPTSIRPDLASTTPALFFTRWATHFCAPTFVFLAGISAWLSGIRRTRAELSRHLIVRGLWLILLEQTWGNVFLFFTYPRVVLGLILWAIGWSMIALAGLIHLPRAAIGAIGLAMIAGHNLFDGVGAGTLVGSLLHSPGFRTLPGGIPILVGYPLIPWIGVMASGYALGPLFLRPSGHRRRVLLALGLGSVAGFVALRWANVLRRSRGRGRPGRRRSSRSCRSSIAGSIRHRCSTSR